jgi:hypothetical protein
VTVITAEARKNVSPAALPDIIADTMRRSAEWQPDVFCALKVDVR